MTEYKKIFLDTTPIIYFLDADINYAEKVEQLFEETGIYKVVATAIAPNGDIVEESIEIEVIPTDDIFSQIFEGMN